jgi:hypothetical protein
MSSILTKQQDILWRVLTEEQLLQGIPWLTRRQFVRLRRQRKIPVVKLGHHTFMYDRANVTAALKRLEVTK